MLRSKVTSGFSRKGFPGNAWLIEDHKADCVPVGVTEPNPHKSCVTCSVKSSKTSL
jgi:hypothetical protein